MGTVSVGDRYEMTRTFTDAHVRAFAEISGDANPIHLDETYAKESLFRGRVVHGMLVAGLLSGILGNHFPGPGTIYLGQTLRFVKPVRLDEPVTAEVVVTELDRARNRATLRTTCRVHQVLVIEGEAKVILPPVPGKGG